MVQIFQIVQKHITLITAHIVRLVMGDIICQMDSVLIVVKVIIALRDQM